MDRDALLEEISRATTPNESSTAIYDARAWLSDHPDDHRVVSAMEDLIEVERHTFGS